MNQRRARWILGLAMPVAMLSSGFGPLIAYRSELPARVASHFDFSGVPDDSMTVLGFALFMGVTIGLGCAACVALALYRRPMTDQVGPIVGCAGGFISGMGAGILAWTVLSQRGLTGWEQAQGPGWVLVGLIGASLAMGAAGAYLGSRLPTVSQQPSHAQPTPAMPLGTGERVVWNTSLHNPWFRGLGLLSLLGAVVTALLAHWAFAILPLIVGLVVIAISGITLCADRGGLRIAYGPLPWPRTRISLEQIASASAIDVRPTEWGGWGYRGSLTLMKRAAVVLRAGPGLRLDLRDGKVFVVTVDDPETPAALLNAEVLRAQV